jgi:hypothetical protein
MLWTNNFKEINERNMRCVSVRCAASWTTNTVRETHKGTHSVSFSHTSFVCRLAGCEYVPGTSKLDPNTRHVVHACRKGGYGAAAAKSYPCWTLTRHLWPQPQHSPPPQARARIKSGHRCNMVTTAWASCMHMRNKTIPCILLKSILQRVFSSGYEWPRSVLQGLKSHYRVPAAAVL